MSTCQQLNLDLMSEIPKLFLAAGSIDKSHVYLFTANFRSDVRNPQNYLAVRQRVYLSIAYFSTREVQPKCHNKNFLYKESVQSKDVFQLPIYLI